MTRRSRDRTWAQQAAADDLADYPRRLEVRGRPRSLTWPAVCANCGAHASERIRVRRAFFRRAGGRVPESFGYRVVSADLPFCAACGARHRATIPQRSWLSRYGWFVFNPAHIATIGCAVLLSIVLRSGPDPSTASSGGRVAWGLAGMLAAGIAWTIGVTWWMTRPSRFEPRTDITSACAISNNVGQFLAARRHIYGFRNDIFADAFARANQSAVWTARDQARMWRTTLVVTVLIIGLVGAGRVLLWYYEGE